MFDQYSQMARSKGFWTRPNPPFACPKMRDNIPCKSKVYIWKDLNECPFKICESPPEFGMKMLRLHYGVIFIETVLDSIAFDNSGESNSYTADWEADFQTYKTYLYPQWTNLLSSYVARFQKALNIDKELIQ